MYYYFVFISDLDLVNPFHEIVDIFIGQDYVSCFVPLEFCRGIRHEPYDVKTPMRYVIHGTNSTHIVSSVVSNFLSTMRLQDYVNKLWELVQCDFVVATGLSAKDSYVVSFLDKYYSFVDGHWQVHIFWKQKWLDVTKQL